jgi:ABC-2 type transport system ATP-binding protein
VVRRFRRRQLPTPTIRAKNLTKIYRTKGLKAKKIKALDNLNLEVKAGEIFGFLGPNGAGKTTAIKIFLGLLFPTYGEVYVFDNSVRDIKTKAIIGYLPEISYYETFMKADELLRFYLRLFKITGRTAEKRIDEVLDIVDLKAFKRMLLSEFSKGMLQRIGIAQALLNEPKLVIFDEPTTGLDPIAQIEVRKSILNLKEAGKTIFLSSHSLLEAEMICTSIAIINKGKLLRCGKISDILSYKNFIQIKLDRIDNNLITVIKKNRETTSIHEEENIIVTNSNEIKKEILEYSIKKDIEVISIEVEKEKLENLFIKLILGGEN